MESEFIIREADIVGLSDDDRKTVEMMKTILKSIIEGEGITIIRSPQDAFHLMRDIIGADRERFYIIHLNTKNEVIERELISIGSLNAAIVHPREVFRSAIEHGSYAIICAHNHPSGNPTPSPEDIEMTHRLIKAGQLVGIDVLDHIIVAQRGYTSLKEQGLV